jgi:hypothetical protein
MFNCPSRRLDEHPRDPDPGTDRDTSDRRDWFERGADRAEATPTPVCATAERRPQIEDNDQTAIEVPAAALSEELADSTRCRCVPRAESQARRSLLANRLPPPVVAASGWAGRAWCAA